MWSLLIKIASMGKGALVVTVAASAVMVSSAELSTAPSHHDTPPAFTTPEAKTPKTEFAVTDACITTSPTIPTSATSCIVKTTNGSYSFSASITPGQTITLYAYWTSPTGANFVGSATTSATVPTTVMPLITLTPRR